MNINRILPIALLVFMSFTRMTEAHVSLLYPVGGEIIPPGTDMNIRWVTLISHQEQTGWELYYSFDEGSTWILIAGGLPIAQQNYIWTVPDILWDDVQVKVIQTGSYYEDTSGSFALDYDIVSVHDAATPGTFAVSNFPNPFNPETTIQFSLPESGYVTLTLYDSTGRNVRDLVSDTLGAGIHSVTWNGTEAEGERVSSGIYFYRLQTGRFTRSGAMTLLR